jgi:hypothetical protein
MNATMIITAINNIANKMYHAYQPTANAINLLNADEAAMVKLIDINADQEAWKVCNELTEWVNNHAA